MFQRPKKLVDSIGETLQSRQKAGKRSHQKVKALGRFGLCRKENGRVPPKGIGDSIGISKRRIPRRPRIDGELRHFT